MLNNPLKSALKNKKGKNILGGGGDLHGWSMKRG
jgi:hypothetical protein